MPWQRHLGSGIALTAAKLAAKMIRGRCSNSRVRYERQIELLIFENTLLVFDPIVEIAATHTQTMSDSMTAYSTAVGPSSSLSSNRRVRKNDFILIAFHIGSEVALRKIRKHSHCPLFVPYYFPKRYQLITVKKLR
jgi:hypothetical protein